MNLSCLNNIITDNLAVHIDISDNSSWNLNTGLSLISLTKWKNAVASDLTLTDFGLTGFDNGRVDDMSDSLIIRATDDKLILNRLGYNDDTTGSTSYSGYTITSITGSSVGNYFQLSGGCVQGFFKLYGYDYELLPPRYSEGITLETLVEINSETEGIFLYLGTRAEDKYNPYYSGETELISATTVTYGGYRDIGYVYDFTGRTTSEDNFLMSYADSGVTLSSFREPENTTRIIDGEIHQVDNLKNNVIAFEVTYDKKIKYKHIDSDGNLRQNESPHQIQRIGWTLISVVFRPYETIDNYESTYYKCYARRKGDLCFYLNGRLFWKVTDFDEFYFIELGNDKEKQEGVPFTVSWGGGSFGLKHSWHYSGFTGTSITQDSRKADLFVENYFDSYFLGNIQKLRIYTVALNSNELLHNARIEASSNSNYNMAVSRGGRVISQYENLPYIVDEVAGSDIVKLIRYKDTDGTYKDLYQMLDIKVVVKSRSNPNVELIKYKKTVESGWTQLTWINDTTYQFIVPDTITADHPNEVLYAEIKFQYIDPIDLVTVIDKIFIVNITSGGLLDSTVKNY